MKTTPSFGGAISGTLILFLLVSVCPLSVQSQHEGHVHDGKLHEHPHTHKYTDEQVSRMFLNSDHPDSTRFGSWESVIPAVGGGAVNKSLGMQTVHSILLPSGKILLCSGSSWRNLGPMQFYPTFPDPAPGQGCFNMYNDPFHEDRLPEYYQLVNNSAIYDPEKNTFYRIPSAYPANDPDEKDHFIPNDFFCTGHMPLPDGRPLFSGGTQYYYPFRTGTRTTYTFDWKKELTIDWKKVDWRLDTTLAKNLWTSAGLMKRGRWYPTLVPLMDGRFAVFSGFVGFQKGYLPMYQFEINSFVEFFDPTKLTTGPVDSAWKAINVKSMPNSPFSTLLKYPQHIENICYEQPWYTEFRIDVTDEGFVPPCDCPERCIEDNKYDAFKLYPHNYLLAPNKIYLTREGDWVSLRTSNTEFMRRTFSTYWMEFGGTREKPEISFRNGPQRLDTITSYGTSYRDPNSGTINILGGQPTSAGTLLPLGSENPNRFAGGLGSRKIEQFYYKDPNKERWTLEPDFMGTEPQDDRTMQYAITLPTKQILIINGGNYDFYGGVLYPILLTPIYDKKGRFLSYDSERMVNAVEPRLYHNVAMLMPDGRVWVSGGNAGRANVYTDVTPPMDSAINRQPLPNPDLVNLDVYFYRDGPMGKGEKGSENTPVENWTAEIFSPPYMFIDGNRRAQITRLEEVNKSQGTFSEVIGGKTYYLLKSNREYVLSLDGLPAGKPGSKASVVLIKTPSVTHGGQWGQHLIEVPIVKENSANQITIRMPDAMKELAVPGYYMLYYLDKSGKPSPAQMVRFDDQATSL